MQSHFSHLMMALISSFIAKENTIGTLGTLLGAQNTGLATQLKVMLTPAAALAFLVVQVLFIPSVATVDAIRSETKPGAVRFHDLRHTFASVMLLRGAKPKVISEALGHASVGFTMDVYSHIIEGMQADAMVLLEKVLPKGVVKNSVANLSPVF